MSLPKSWSVTKIGELFDIGSGKTVDPEARTLEPKYPFLRTANVLWGRIDLFEVDRMHFTPEGLKTKTLQPGDLLVCEGGDIGRAALWDGRIENCGFQNHLHRLRPKHIDAIPAFFMYALQAGFTLHASYEGTGNRTTIPNLSRSRLAALEVPEPPSQEQTRIASVLALVQRAIELEERLIAATRELKESAMRQLFTRGLRNERQKGTDIGPLPETWQVVPLGLHLTKAQYGLSVRGQPMGRFPILRMNCQLDGQVIFRDLQFVDVDKNTFDMFRLNDGDLLFNRTNSYELVGRTAIFRSTRDAVFASYLIRLTLDQTVFHPEFVNYYFNQPSVQATLKTLASRGVSQANINASKLKDFLIPMTDIDEQRTIAAVLQKIDHEISIHERRRVTLRDLFKTLLDQLMTGAIRVDKLKINTAVVTKLT